MIYMYLYLYFMYVWCVYMHVSMYVGIYDLCMYYTRKIDRMCRYN